MRLLPFRGWIIIGVLFITGICFATNFSLGEITPGQYLLEPVTNHLPETYRDSKKYWDSLQKVQLEIGNQEQFKDLPDLKMKKPYTGNIVLGDKSQKFGVIIDIVGDEKRLYIARKGSGSFAAEPWVPLLNEWEGLQSYWVCAPEPITLQVSYRSKQDQVFPIEISVIGMINQPGLFVKEKPYLLVQVRTWFLGKIKEDNCDKLVAVVDADNNGRYNDPKDLLVIDYNDDTEFTSDESIARLKGVKLQNAKRKWTFDWEVYPDKLTVNQVQ